MKCPIGASHSEIMRELGRAWAITKAGTRAEKALQRLEAAFAAPGARNINGEEWIEKMMGSLNIGQK